MSSFDVQQADADLWLAYGVKLKDALDEAPSLGSDSRFYIAPLSAAGIAAGKKIPNEIKDNGVFNVGDALLDLDQPVFLPTSQSYFQRCQSYCSSVALESDNNMGAAVRYNDAQEKARKALEYFTNTKMEAMSAYNAERNDGITSDQFSMWAQAANDAATANCAAAAAAMSGPKAAMVGRYMSALNTANGLMTVPGFNMACSTASADQIASGQLEMHNQSFQKPLYQIDSHYARAVDSWVATFSQNKDSPTEITFNPSDASNSSWEELGYDDDNVEVTESYCIFFSATFWEDNERVTKTVSAEEVGDDLEITLTTTGLGMFQIQPGKWNPSELAGMPLVSNADENLKKPMAHVTKAVLAYGVGMQVNLSEDAFSTINDYLEKAQETGGSASIFGFNIGLGGSADSGQTSTVTFDDVKNASSGNTITIPPSDNSYPTLLAVVGESIPTSDN
ncbi:hypothetical protein NW768_009705 [Fusarium equiseti]|uniref:Uncharacterized protein n=1 Tax=Fusarium equiseti TaxID=61235 RepID=A0ABQ8R1P1_FUSEQ|nr:hypothetical protein NW768_009705 [Fusarium equiseti]